MKNRKFLALLTALITLGGITTLTSCSGTNDNTYVIENHYDDSTKNDIPSDAVNQVMFAYSESVDVTFRTELKLNEEEKTYILTKTIQTALFKNDEGNEVRNYDGGYEFKGSFTGESNDIILSIPTESKYYCYYPTVLNYKSVEKQTQDWVSSTEEPFILTRFNKWYPAKNSGTKEQPVTLNNKSMTFADVKFEEDKPSTPDPTPAPTEKEVKITATGQGGKVLKFYTDKTYEWNEPTRNLKEEGTFLLNEQKQIVLTCSNGTVITSTLDESNNQTIVYAPSTMGGYASALSDTFVLSVGQWGQLTLIK